MQMCRQLQVLRLQNRFCDLSHVCPWQGNSVQLMQGAHLRHADGIAHAKASVCLGVGRVQEP